MSNIEEKESAVIMALKLPKSLNDRLIAVAKKEQRTKVTTIRIAIEEYIIKKEGASDRRSHTFSTLDSSIRGMN